MFTGLVETMGVVSDLAFDGVGCTLTLSAPAIAGELQVGDSVCVNGACLTVVSLDGPSFRFQLGPETLHRTNLGGLTLGDRVNLERSLRLQDRLGGHLVQGHVDGVGHVADRLTEGDWVTVWFRCDRALSAQMVAKGSIAVDGVSLTVVGVRDQGFSVALIPHTLAGTTLGFKGVGAAVNLETDLLAKYVWKCFQVQGPQMLRQLAEEREEEDERG